ncbi:MAG: murein biosynthesis integral membrane protein MurJ [Methylovulum sp.]|nr:MAG: murein biosynthesis integral membrane protein MurJ [Methylovulum sp.]
MSRQLFKSTVAVGSMTFISRILGFVRDMLIARIFGVDLATDAFFVAFKIPNFLRRLFTEGAFAHAFVPALADYREQGGNAALKQFVDKTAGTLAVLLVLMTLTGIVVAPVLVRLLAPGFAWQGAQHESAVLMLQIMLPYLCFIALVAFAGSLLNAHGQFVVPAITPAFLNIGMIIGATRLAPLMAEPVTALAWSVVAAGLVQLLFQIPPLMRLGLMPRLRPDFHDAGVKRLINQLAPAIFSVSVTQVNLLLDTLIASFLAVGSVSWLYYSDRLVEFPLGVLGLALGTVILPSLAKHHGSEDPASFSNSLDWGLRLVLLAGLPAMTGLLALAEPVLSTLFQYHEFSADDVHYAAQSLRAYAIGLPAYLLVKVLVPGFTARRDLKTPVRYGIYAMLASLVLNVLAVPLAHAGLALATSLGAVLNAVLLLKKLAQDRVFKPANGWRLFLLRVTLASLAMFISLYYLVDAQCWNLWSPGERVINLLKWIMVGMVVYAATLVLTGLRLRHVMR